MTPTLSIWLALTGIIALEICIIAGLGFLLQRLTRSAYWRRTIWQVCLVAVIVLPMLELTGSRGYFSRQSPAASAGQTDTQNGAGAVRLTEEFRSQVLARAALKKNLPEPANQK